ncbi:MAG: nucleotidyltransferase domain-containing protein [Dehalococcoidia bacterium]|nr:nucleotidyltransferase domain-containing protein [Dehalococcoidia bacterium]
MSTGGEQASGGVIIRPHWLAMVREILQRHVPEREALAFGSRVTGGNRPFSDLDIAIAGDTPLDDATLFRLIETLEESDLPINVDVVQLALAGPHINEAVAKHGVVIHTAGKSL